MLTPQEVSERSFTKSSFGGYNMGMVDDFLDLLTADYTALYNENAVLKSKMKVLVDKVEEYRSTEEAMRKALLTAQRIADEMVAEAEEKKKAMLAQAEADCAQRLTELERAIADEETRLVAAKQATGEYVDMLKKELAKEVDFISKLEGISAPVKQEDTVQTTARDIEETLQQIVAKEVADSAATRVFSAEEVAAAVEEAEAEEQEHELGPELVFATADLTGELNEEITPQAVARDDAEDNEPTTRRRIDFSNLQFGADYEIE